MFNFSDDRITICIIHDFHLDRWKTREGRKQKNIDYVVRVRARRRTIFLFLLFSLSLFFFYFFSFFPLRLPWLHWNASKISRTTKERGFVFSNGNIVYRCARDGKSQLAEEGNLELVSSARIRTYFDRKRPTYAKLAATSTATNACQSAI